jgi:RNA polymerase sigma-70 factor (ECF subfamily)
MTFNTSSNSANSADDNVVSVWPVWMRVEPVQPAITPSNPTAELLPGHKFPSNIKPLRKVINRRAVSNLVPIANFKANVHHAEPDDIDFDVKPVVRKSDANREILGAVYKSDYRKFYFGAYKIVKCAMMAADIVHDAFVKARSRAAQFEGKSQLSTYIYRIVLNQALDVVRSHGYKASNKGGAKQSADCENKWAKIYPIVPRPFLGPEKSFLLKEQLMYVQAGLQQMSAKKREVLEDYAFEGVKIKDIAKSRGIALGTCLSRLNAARLELRP